MEFTSKVYQLLMENKLVLLQCNSDGSMQEATATVEVTNNDDSSPPENTACSDIDRAVWLQVRRLSSQFLCAFRSEYAFLFRTGPEYFNSLGYDLVQTLDLPVHSTSKQVLLERGSVVAVMKCFDQIQVEHLPVLDANLLKSLPEPVETIVQQNKLKVLLFIGN